MLAAQCLITLYVSKVRGAEDNLIIACVDWTVSETYSDYICLDKIEKVPASQAVFPGQET